MNLWAVPGGYPKKKKKQKPFFPRGYLNRKNKAKRVDDSLDKEFGPSTKLRFNR